MLVEEFDRTWSRFRTDSLVQRMATAPGTWQLPPEAEELQAVYRALYTSSHGAVSPLVGRALEQWGYDRTYSLIPAAVIDPIPHWDESISWTGRTLTTTRPVVLDIGAAGKGLLVDLVSAVLAAEGHSIFTVDGSGDILHRGPEPLRVALEHPRSPGRAIGVAPLSDGALCASASNRRAWPGAHHILDAITGRPVADVIATWVWADRAIDADGVSTALFVADPKLLAEEFEFEFVRMFSSGRIDTSRGFVGEIFA